MTDHAAPPTRDAPIQEQRAHWRGLLNLDRAALGADIIHTEARRNLERLDAEEAKGQLKADRVRNRFPGHFGKG